MAISSPVFAVAAPRDVIGGQFLLPFLRAGEAQA